MRALVIILIAGLSSTALAEIPSTKPSDAMMRNSIAAPTVGTGAASSTTGTDTIAITAPALASNPFTEDGKVKLGFEGRGNYHKPQTKYGAPIVPVQLAANTGKPAAMPMGAAGGAAGAMGGPLNAGAMAKPAVAAAQEVTAPVVVSQAKRNDSALSSDSARPVVLPAATVAAATAAATNIAASTNTTKTAKNGDYNGPLIVQGGKLVRQ